MEKLKLYYKVVTDDMRSLGLRQNPNIMTFAVGKWAYEPAPKEGDCDDGGIWCARSLSKAKGLARYMERKHGMLTRIFACETGTILYSNDYRVKSDRVRLVEEIKPN